MNAKLCKKMRRAVIQQALQFEPRKLAVFNSGPKKGQIVNHPQTKRAIYRQLKQQVRAEQRKHV